MFMKYTVGHAPLSTDDSGSSRDSPSPQLGGKKIHLFPILLQEITNKVVVFFLKTFGSIYFSCPFPMTSSIKIQYLSLYYLECISLLCQTSCHHKTQAYRENKTGRRGHFQCSRQEAAWCFTPLLPLVAGRRTALQAVAATCGRTPHGASGRWQQPEVLHNILPQQQWREAPCGLLLQAAETA